MHVTMFLISGEKRRTFWKQWIHFVTSSRPPPQISRARCLKSALSTNQLGWRLHISLKRRIGPVTDFLLSDVHQLDSPSHEPQLLSRHVHHAVQVRSPEDVAGVAFNCNPVPQSLKDTQSNPQWRHLTFCPYVGIQSTQVLVLKC